MPRVLITTEAVRKVPGKHLDMLHAAGYDVRYPAKSVLLTEDETLEAMQGHVAVHAGGEPYTERVLAGLPELRVIARNGVGYDRIDVEAATRHGVAVAITPEGNHQAVAEHALALLLAVARRVVQDAIDTRGGSWRRQKVFVPLRGSTLGIVGLGRGFGTTGFSVGRGSGRGLSFSAMRCGSTGGGGGAGFMTSTGSGSGVETGSSTTVSSSTTSIGDRSR